MFKLFYPVKEYVFYLDVSCKFSKLQNNSLAFVWLYKGLLMRVYYPKLREILSPYDVFTASKGSNLYILFMARDK